MYKIGSMPKSIPIGYTGETNFRNIEIDMTAWLDKMPDGVPSIVHIRPGESKADAYVAVTEFNQETGILSWTITAADVGTLEGEGEMQVWLEETENDTVTKRGKSVKVITKVIEAANSPDSNPPSGQEAFLEQINSLKNQTVAAAEEAEDAQEAAETAQAAAEQAAQDAENVNLHPAYIDSTTKHWMVYDAANHQYTDTQIKAVGEDGQDGQDGQDATPDLICLPYEDLTFPVSKGTLCYHGSDLCKAKQDISTSEAWTAAHWDVTNIDTELRLQKNAIEGMKPIAQQSDIGKALILKTIDQSGKPTAFEYGEAGQIDPQDIADAVDDWLDEHPEAVTTVEDGAITKAKLNGEVSAYIKTADYITGWDDPSITVEDGFITSTGGNGSAGTFQRTSYIPVSEGNTFAYKLYGGGGYCAYGYDSSKNPVNGSGVAGQEKYTEGTYTVPSGVAFVRFSTKKTSIGYFNSNQKIKEVFYPSNILNTIMSALTNKSATQGDVGKYPIIKTVTDGVVSEWEYSEQTAYLVAGTTETDIDIKATGSMGTGSNSWGLTPKVEDVCFVKELELKITSGNAATIFRAEYISASSYKVTDRIGMIVADKGEGYYKYSFSEPYRLKVGEFLIVTFAKNYAYYQTGSGLANQYIVDSSNPVLAVGNTYTGTMSWGSYALCSKVTFLDAVNGDISNDFYNVKRVVSEESSKVDDLEKYARGQQYISVFFDNFNEAKTDWVNSDNAWSFDYTNRELSSVATGDVSTGSNCLILDRMYHADKRVASFRIKFASDTVIDIGFRSKVDNSDGVGKVRIDLENQLLIIYNGFTTVAATKDISSYAISTDKWYIVEVERKNLIASLRIRDFTTGNEVSLDYEFPNGFFFDELYTLGKASGGDVVIKEFNVSMMLNPLVYIIGDSITAYSSQIGGWSYLLNRDLNDNVVVSGRGNDTGASAPVKFETEARFIKPRYLMWCYGHNGEGINASRLAAMQELCDEIGCKFIVNHMTCMREDLHIGRNEVVEEGGYRGARFDVATARDGNPYPVQGDPNIRADSNLYMDTNIHPNLAGNLKMYERLKIDVPELFYR